MRALALALVVVSGCASDPTIIQAPTPAAPPLTCTSECPLERPETARKALKALGQCVTAWQTCRTEALLWRAREDAIEGD